ncbi:hypothetical protein pb186bvf_011444 [Paramecium bursaria]
MFSFNINLKYFRNTQQRFFNFIVTVKIIFYSQNFYLLQWASLSRTTTHLLKRNKNNYKNYINKILMNRTQSQSTQKSQGLQNKQSETNLNKHSRQRTYEEIKLNSKSNFNSEDKRKPKNNFIIDSPPRKISTPLKSKTEHIIHSQIRIIFIFYSQFGDRHNITYLKSNKLQKMLQDCELGSKISNKDIDIIYYSITQNKETLNIEQFKSLLLKLAQKFYPNLDAVQSFKEFYNSLKQIYVKIVTQTEFGDHLQTLEQLKQGNRVITLFNQCSKLVGVFTKLHEYAFKDHNQKISQINQQYNMFLLQFDIIPGVISQSQAQIIFFDLHYRNPLIKIKIEGNHIFSFDKFMESVLIIAILQDTRQATNDIQKLKILLERMELSEGFTRFTKYHYQSKTESIQLVFNFSRNISFDKELTPQKNSSGKKFQNSNISFAQEQQPLDEDSSKRLQNLFQYYSQLGEPMNITNLKSIKYKKIFQNAQLCPQVISQVDLDLIYIQGTQKRKVEAKRNSSFILIEKDDGNGKMQFNDFIKTLSVIGQKYFEGKTEDMVYKYLIPLEEQIRIEKQEQILQILVQLLQDQQIIALFKEMHNTFDKYFNYYTRSTMNLPQFMKFCHDFDLANCIVSKTVLLHIFQAISSMNNQDYLDKHQFVEAISIIAVLVYQNVSTYIQRVIFLLEKIFNSNAAGKIANECRFVRPDQTEYSQVLKQSKVSKISQSFDDIVNQF